jgi:hypothetical protein
VAFELPGRYSRPDLLLLDELGYVQIDHRGAELLFQIITEREEGAGVAIGTNLPFSEWGTVFPDPRLVAAIVDRATFNAHILETGTQSYRLRTGKTTSRGKNPAKPHRFPAGAETRADQWRPNNLTRRWPGGSRTPTGPAGAGLTRVRLEAGTADAPSPPFGVTDRWSPRTRDDGQRWCC